MCQFDEEFCPPSCEFYEDCKKEVEEDKSLWERNPKALDLVVSLIREGRDKPDYEADIKPALRFTEALRRLL